MDNNNLIHSFEEIDWVDPFPEPKEDSYDEYELVRDTLSLRYIRSMRSSQEISDKISKNHKFFKNNKYFKIFKNYENCEK